MSWSQTTLVNPEPPTVLLFSHPTMLNTGLSLKGQPYVKVATVDAAGACTTITYAGTSQLMATIKRRTLFSDTVKFPNKYGGKAIKQKEWLVEREAIAGRWVYPVCFWLLAIAWTNLRGHDRKAWTLHTPSGTFLWRVDPVYRLAVCLPFHFLPYSYIKYIFEAFTRERPRAHTRICTISHRR